MLPLLVAIACLPVSLGCPGAPLNKRAEGVDWAYDASYNWGMINSNYSLCQSGTTQSPIALSLTPGLAQKHVPTFSSAYSSISGDLYNWGYGPAFTVSGTDTKAKPSMAFDNSVLYLKSWHIHAPADHSVQGQQSRAELHLVHSDENGKEAGVFALRIDPGLTSSHFFAQFLSVNGTSNVPTWTSTQTIPLTLDISLALSQVGNFNEFWTYMGSLTSPPCTEGIRWWVGRQAMFVSGTQLQEILSVSTFSARVEHIVWGHGVNV